MTIGLQRLAEREEVLGPIIAHQRLRNGLRGGLDGAVAVLGQQLRVALPPENRVQDRQPRDPGDVAQDVMELEVHLVQRLLDVLDVSGRQVDQGVAMPEERAHRTDGLGRPEGGAEEAHGVQVLEPLAVLHIGLPPRHVLDVAGIHEADRESPPLQDLVQGDPVDAGGLHGDRGHAALLEPPGQRPQVRREGPEAPDGLRVAVERHADVDLGCADVDAGGVGVEDWRGGSSGRARADSGHGASPR